MFSESHRYVLVGIDYFTKWVEVVPLTNFDQDIVIDFIQSQIMLRYGTPETISIDQGSIFIGRKVMEFVVETKIKFLILAPYYAQANGQVKALNKVIVNLIKKHIGKKPMS